MNGLIQQAAALSQRQQAERAAAVEDLRDRQAAGELPDPAEIVRVTEAAGVSIEDYAASVEWKEMRLALTAELATAPALQKQFDEAKRAEFAETARWEKLVKEHEALAGPLRSKVLTLDQAIARARGCLDKLRETYRGPLLAELEAIEESRRQISMRLESLQKPRPPLRMDAATRGLFEQEISQPEPGGS